MTDERKPPRRKEFDDIVAGWGSDSADDLSARIAWAEEWLGKHGSTSDAEQKTITAMHSRLDQIRSGK